MPTAPVPLLSCPRSPPIYEAYVAVVLRQCSLIGCTVGAGTVVGFATILTAKLKATTTPPLLVRVPARLPIVEVRMAIKGGASLALTLAAPGLFASGPLGLPCTIVPQVACEIVVLPHDQPGHDGEERQC